MFVCTHGHTQPQPFKCHGLTKSNRTHKQYTLVCDTVWVPVVWIYSLSFLPLSSSSPPLFSFFPPWSGRGAASCAPALLLGHFCPTWSSIGLQDRGSPVGCGCYKFIYSGSTILQVKEPIVINRPHSAKRDCHIGVKLIPPDLVHVSCVSAISSI